MPRITEAHCISLDDSGPSSRFVFIVPRGEDMLVLGGLAEPDEWDLDIGLHNYEPVRQMLPALRATSCRALANAEIDAAEPVRVGLRPVRNSERSPGSGAGARIVHNYGHGGSGVTFSWGCALEVVDLVEHMICSEAAAGRA